MEEHQFSWFHYVPLLSGLEPHVAGALTVAVILAVFALAARLALAANPNYLVAPGKLSFLNFADIVSEGLYNMTESVLGHEAPTYFPVIGGLFLYILINNLIGIIPGMEPPSANVNTNLACGIFVFVYYNYQGLKHGGLHYLKHFCGPVWYLAWLLLPIEIVSHVARPFTLALRLRGNMVGDHTVLRTFTELSPHGLIIPIPLYFLGIMVCVIQAYVFVMLTMVYVSLAKESDH